MRRASVCLAFVFLSFLAVSVGFAQVKWIPRLKDALQLAQAGRQFVVVDVAASWCPPCIRMESRVFKDPRFVTFAQSQVFMHVDAERDVEGRDIAFKFKVHSYPTILVLSSTGEEIHRLIGGRDTDQLIRDLEEVFRDPRATRELEEDARLHPDNQAVLLAAGKRLLHQDDAKAAVYLRRAADTAATAEQKTDALVLLVGSAQRAGRFEESLSASAELVRLLPGFGEYEIFQTTRARALIGLRKYDEAAAFVETMMRRGVPEWTESARELLAELPGKYRKADKELQKTVAVVQKLFDEGKLLEARAAADPVVEKFPYSADLQVLLSGILFRLGENEADAARRGELFATGLNHLRVARRLNPTDMRHYNIAKSTLASRYMPLVPSSPEAAKVYRQAERQAAEGRCDDAVKLFRKTIELEPSFGRAYARMGECLFLSGRASDAVSLYKEATGRTPLDPVGHRLGANALSGLGRAQEARECLINSLLADPECPAVWEDFTRLATKNGKELARHSEAIPLRFLVLSPDSYAESLFDGLLPEAAEAWRAYSKEKLLWRSAKFSQNFPKEKFYHATADEEVESLALLVDIWNTAKQENRELYDESLDFLSQVEREDLLEAFVYLELFTEEYRIGYERWKKEHSAKAIGYVERYLLGTGEARPVSTVSAAPSRVVAVPSRAASPTPEDEQDEEEPEVAPNSLEAATQAVLDEEYDAAIKILTSLLSTLKDETSRQQALLMLGVSYSQTENWKEAQRCLSTYLKKNPGNMEASQLLKDVEAKLRK